MFLADAVGKLRVIPRPFAGLWWWPRGTWTSYCRLGCLYCKVTDASDELRRIPVFPHLASSSLNHLVAMVCWPLGLGKHSSYFPGLAFDSCAKNGVSSGAANCSERMERSCTTCDIGLDALHSGHRELASSSVAGPQYSWLLASFGRRQEKSRQKRLGNSGGVVVMSSNQSRVIPDGSCSQLAQFTKVVKIVA